MSKCCAFFVGHRSSEHRTRVQVEETAAITLDHSSSVLMIDEWLGAFRAKLRLIKYSGSIDSGVLGYTTAID